MSTWFKRAVRRLLERLLDKWREGPEPPPRLVQDVATFALYHPHASHVQWSEFALTLARSSYQDGWIRGREWEERCWPGEPDYSAPEFTEHVPLHRIRAHQALAEFGGRDPRENARLEAELARMGVRIIKERVPS